jgi:quinol monooxygenase YgiN
MIVAIYMTARFQVRPEARARCEQAIREFVAYVKAHEPHTQLYTSVQEAGDATRFLHFFVFDDAAARDVHSSSAAVQRFTDVLYSETLTPVEFAEYELVASTAG